MVKSDIWNFFKRNIQFWPIFYWKLAILSLTMIMASLWLDTSSDCEAMIMGDFNVDLLQMKTHPQKWARGNTNKKIDYLLQHWRMTE